MIRVLKKYESQASQTGALALATVFFLLEMFRRCLASHAYAIESRIPCCAIFRAPSSSQVHSTHRFNEEDAAIAR